MDGHKSGSVEGFNYSDANKNSGIGVVDLDAQKVVHRLSGLKEPQGVAYVQGNDSLYVANGGDGSVRVFRGTCAGSRSRFWSSTV